MNKQIARLKTSMEMIQEKRNVFSAVLAATKNLGMLQPREVDILKARYNDTPISLIEKSWFVSVDGQGRNVWKEKQVMWNSLVGTRDALPDPFQETFLLEFLVKEYGGMTFSEIELAFKMNMLGEFATVIEHFNKLDVKFLSQIVNAYKIKRLESDKKYKEVCHNLQFLPPPIEDKELADYHSGMHVYLKFKDWCRNGQGNALYVDYKFLVRMGVLIESEEDMEKALFFVQKEMSNQMDDEISDSGQIGALLGKDDMLTTRMEDRAKSLIVVNLFEKLKEGNMDFQALLRSHLSTYHKNHESGANTPPESQTQKSHEPTSN